MEPADIAQRYFAAWNAHDGAAIAAVFSEGGTYEDPSSGLLRRDDVAAYAQKLWAAFPDVQFEILRETITADTVAAEWIMRGANSGSFAGLPPTGRSVELRGADFIVTDTTGIRSVRGYFDSRELPSQLGLQVLVQPQSVGPFTFGSAVAVQSGKKASPGVYGITELQASSAEAAAEISERSRSIVSELAVKPGFIGWLGVSIGRRMITVTAWESMPDLQALQTGLHQQAMARFMTADMASGGVTSVWVPERINGRLVRCISCGAMMNFDRSAGRCTCDAALPEPQPYW